jgi:hypothetical protein
MPAPVWIVAESGGCNSQEFPLTVKNPRDPIAIVFLQKQVKTWSTQCENYIDGEKGICRTSQQTH